MTLITRQRGDTVPDQRTITDANGDPVDITGYAYLLTINSERDPDDATQQITQSTGVLVDPGNGVVQFPWTTFNIEPSIYWFDIQQTDDQGKIKTIEKDVYFVEQDITK